MDSAYRVLLFVFCVGLASASGQSSPVPPAVLGMWSAGLVDTIGSVQGQQGCSAVTISDHQIRLSASPDTNKLEGVWIRTEISIWLTTDNRNCRWFPEETKFQPEFETTRFYVLDAVYDTARGVMGVDARVANCDGNGCNRFAAASARKPFHTELKMNNGRLVGMKTDDPSDDLDLIRASDEADRAYDASTLVATWLKMLDAGDFGQFYDQATSASFRSIATRKDFIDRLSTQRDRVGTTMSRQTNTLYAEFAPFISKSPGEYVLFWSGVESTKSGRGLEFMLLVNDGGTWKVTWFNYGA
jgi:Protein of unknown function (DUF4019)